MRASDACDGLLFSDILKNHVYHDGQQLSIPRENRINILTKSSKPSKVPLNSAQALSISEVGIFRRKIRRTLVALHDDPDSGADTLVDEL